MKLFKKVKHSFFTDDVNGQNGNTQTTTNGGTHSVENDKENDNITTTTTPEEKPVVVNGANNISTSSSTTPPSVEDNPNQQVVLIVGKDNDRKESLKSSIEIKDDKDIQQTSNETNTSPQPVPLESTTPVTTTSNSNNNSPNSNNKIESSPVKEQQPQRIATSPSSLSLKSTSSLNDHTNSNSMGSNGGGFFSKLKKLYKGDKVGDKKSFKGHNDSSGNGGHNPNQQQLVPGQNTPPGHVPLHLQDEKVEREVIFIRALEELPEDCQKLMRASGIPEEKFKQNLQTLLYVLHFRTGKIFKLYDEPPREPRKKFVSERFSDGETLIEHVEYSALKKLYKDTDQVGKGGFGTVYFAKSTKDKKTVAIKKMPHITKRQITQNLREASILSKCNHPNIVKLITCHIDKEQNLWLIMEFMEGGTFEEAAKAWRFNENNLAYVARELLKGLQYLHENGMVHRDLKSANIMMSVEGKVKLIDFGLCEDISTGSPCHMVGSPFWMPPEMIHQKPHSTPVDIWSFAISLLEMANQRPPMMESAVKAMFTVATEGATGFDHPDLWTDVFKDFLSLCLKPEPSERATAVELLQHPFIKKADTRDNMENILKKIFLTNSLMNSGF